MNEIKIWNSTLEAAMKLPFVNVNRQEFLKKELSQHCSQEDIIAILEGSKRVIDVVSKDKMERIAQGSIKYHLTIVTSTSAIAGIPGGWWAAGTIPTDIAQFFGHALCLSQKLLYLYGFEDLNGGEEKITDNALQILTLFIGVMMGSQAAEVGIKKLLVMVAKGVPTQLSKKAVTKTALYQLVKQIAKFLGVKLSKDSFLKGVGKFIPILGAPISGALTYWTFRPMARRLKDYLSKNYTD